MEQNDALAVAWWEKAAVGVDAVAQYNLASEVGNEAERRSLGPQPLPPGIRIFLHGLRRHCCNASSFLPRPTRRGNDHATKCKKTVRCTFFRWCSERFARLGKRAPDFSAVGW